MTIENILFLCPDNAVSSIMAEAYMNHAGRGLYRAYSAGLKPARAVDPQVCEVLKDVGVRAHGLTCKSISAYTVTGAPEIDRVIALTPESLGARAAMLPRHPDMVHWSTHIAEHLHGTHRQRKTAILELFAELRRQIDGFLIETPVVIGLDGRGLDGRGLDGRAHSHAVAYPSAA